ELQIIVMHTPGHTEGSISLFCKEENAVFTGDTLFAGSVGRTDFPGASLQKLLKSLNERLLKLPDETMVYPGHGGKTTIGRERRTNPFLNL
ncbi:MBL fold metallo-hydrolase, partial [Candidatus Bathyarchaeota archaeon]|nr:MBL fold metallo-hydrolase [Candidatus Bathyarchaeota archaeon]